ncbi:hypothetical protein D9M71_724260 [compost metagenome]
MKDYGFEPYVSEALEEVQEIYGEGDTARSLLKITLPVDQAPDLLVLCSKLGVDGSTMFPGFHGVAKSVRDWVNSEIGVRPSASMMDELRNDSYGDD